MLIRMPEPLDFGKFYGGMIGALIAHAKDYDPEYDNPLGQRTVMGRALPSWQRDLVWTAEQKTRFIESAWNGTGLGTYTVNNNNIPCHPLNNLLIDGQQRISAIESYLNDEFPVFGARWSEIDRQDQLRFKMTKFASYETSSTDEKYLRSYYDLMNFGGTKHDLSQTADFDASRFADQVIETIGKVFIEIEQADPIERAFLRDAIFEVAGKDSVLASLFVTHNLPQNKEQDEYPAP